MSISDQESKYPQKYRHFEVENKWQQEWERLGVYQWDPAVPRENTYVVDTPPPTVSGSLHVGHAYSYAQTDVMVRYHRMRGKNIFYPMGWDDNGLPTERRAQNVFNIRCEAHLPYDPDWKPDRQKSKEIRPVSRQNFIETCELITREDEKAFESTWRKLGLSVDWSLIYTTIGDHCRRISQLSFLDLVQKGLAYNTESITMWDVDFKTAVSQAEVEDREIPGAYHDLRFGLEDGGEFIISTTRPELLAACIAVAAHPGDKRYRDYFGKKAITPLFKVPVPIVASEHADPEKGSGILMICTFGDLADVEWWRKSGMPIRQVIGMDGRLLKITFGQEGAFASLEPDSAQEAWDQLAHLTVKAAKKKIVELLSAEGSAADGKNPALKGSPRPVTHTVRFYEKGYNPLEFIPTRQWFIKILEFKEELLGQGKKIAWHPEHMRTRYDHWVMGLNQEWCISRQRYFGVPLPVWYPVLDNGQPDYEHPLLPEKEALPVDPLSDVPPGYSADRRDKPGGFTGEGDVMDTWATSSLTPQLSSYWGIDAERHEKLFPTDLRPQAHDIIRTWAFYTIVKAWLHEKKIPWQHAAISGFILDPDRKKMSKSKGNVLTPEALLNEHSSDVFRYWASRGRLGVDSAFDETPFKIGRKLVIKIFNASKFVFTQLDGVQESFGQLSLDHAATECDRAWIAIFRKTLETAAAAFENYDYTTALQAIEDTFWYFCDNYLEMVKTKAYEGGKTPESRSALVTLNWSLKTFLRLFAPFMPFLTEEIWSWRYSGESVSIHKASWPMPEEIAGVEAPVHEESFAAALEVISRVRGFKTENKVSQKRPIAAVEIRGKQDDLDAIRLMIPYIVESTNVEASPLLSADNTLKEEEGRFQVTVTLGEYKE
jgi:valyl-tRNA synthetase